MKWTLLSAILLSTSPLLSAPVIFGEYIEVRSPASWLASSGQMSEMRAAGELALLGWIVQTGSWDGVELKGLSVALAVRAEGSLCPQNAARARSLIYVDERASKRQESALVSMVRSLAGNWLQNVVDTRRLPITYTQKNEDSILQVGREVKIKVRASHHACDLQLEGELSAEPPLAAMDHAHTAEVESCEYRAPGLDLGPSQPKSALVSEFSL